MIRIESLQKSFITSAGIHAVMHDISFDVPDASFTTIFGPNGCGKSTLVNLIAGIEKPDGGQILFPQGRVPTVGYVFQDYRRSLLPWGTVEENILFPLRLRGIAKTVARKSLDELFARTKIALNPSQRVISLSGGQAQAVSILRALIIQPTLLILDEPFAALDYERTLALRSLLSQVCCEMKLTVLFISHDLDEALSLGDRVIFLSRAPSQIVEVLPVPLPYPRDATVLTSPQFVALKQRALAIFDRCCGSVPAVSTGVI